MKLIFKILIPVAILAAGVILMVVFINLKPEDAARPDHARSKHVEGLVVHPGPVAARVQGFGRVASAQPIDLFSEVSGTLQRGSVEFLPGQSFRRGELLAKVDDRQIEMNINSRKADLLTALATVLPEIKADFPGEFQIWQDYFDACEFDQPLPALPETSSRKVKLFLSRFNVYKLYFAARDLEVQREKHYFYAPFDGSIVTANLRPSSAVRPGSLLGRIISVNQLEVEIPLAAEDIRWMDQQAPVRFVTDDGRNHLQGMTSRVGSIIDDRTQTVSVFVKVDREDVASMIDGVFLSAEMPGIVIDPGVRVPRQALYNDSYVYVVTDGKLEYRQVNVVRRELEDVIIDQGLSDGDTLVVEVLQGVASGMPATVRLPGSDQGSL